MDGPVRDREILRRTESEQGNHCPVSSAVSDESSLTPLEHEGLQARFLRVASGSHRPKDRFEMIGGVAIACRDERPVDVHRCRCTRVPEPVGHRSNVDTLRQQLGGNEMAQVVEPDVGQPCLDSKSFPPARGELRPPRADGSGIVGEDEVLGIHESAVPACDELRSASVRLQRLDCLGRD